MTAQLDTVKLPGTALTRFPVWGSVPEVWRKALSISSAPGLVSCELQMQSVNVKEATPTGWFVDTLDLVDRKLADQTVIDLVNDFRQRGCLEWCFGETAQLPNYLASGTNPLAGIRKMRKRRDKTFEP